MTQIVNTLALNEGDIVQIHGGRFQLTRRRVYDGKVAFDSIVLDRGNIPATYISAKYGWVVQGNERAFWEREF